MPWCMFSVASVSQFSVCRSNVVSHHSGARIQLRAGLKTPRESRAGEKRSGNLSTDSSEPTASIQHDPGRKPRSGPKEIIKKLVELGPSGIAAYGILNSLYYTGVVVFIFLLRKPDGHVGLQQAVQKLVEAFFSAWALSQLTKLPRALGAIALAPFTNGLMKWMVQHTWIQNRRQGLVAIALACLLIVTTVLGCLLLTVV